MRRILYHAVRGYTSPLARRFDRALRDPENAQQQVLDAIVKDLIKTEYGAHLNIKHVDDFKNVVPLVNYDDVSEWMQRQRSEEGKVIVASDVVLYEKTSGSTGPHKYIPYTKELRRSFTRMFLLWAHDLISNVQGLGKGKFYFSVSPNFDEERLTEKGVPVGLDNDADYLGPTWSHILSPFMLADSRLGKIRDPEAFKKSLSLSLLGCKDLETISVWNPSFLTLVMQWIEENRDVVLRDLGSELSPNQILALQSETINWPKVWPRLSLISCWADANAHSLAAKLGASFPGVYIQGKGLLATEAPMTIPMVNVRGGVPLVSETYFEFLCENGDVCTISELRKGLRYEIVISQRGGLYRYRMGDQVEVVGEIHNTPTLRFVGRNNRTSDLVGEKLNEAFVRDVIESLEIKGEGFRGLMAMRNPKDGYVLILDRAVGNEDVVGERLEAGLQEAYHYRHARALGQLAAAKVAIVPNIEGIISDQVLEKAKSLGDMKQNYLMMADDGLERALDITTSV